MGSKFMRNDHVEITPTSSCGIHKWMNPNFASWASLVQQVKRGHANSPLLHTGNQHQCYLTSKVFKVAWVQTILHLGLGFTNEQDTLTLDRGAMHQRSSSNF